MASDSFQLKNRDQSTSDKRAERSGKRHQESGSVAQQFHKRSQPGAKRRPLRKARQEHGSSDSHRREGLARFSEEAEERAWYFALRFMHSGPGRGFCGAHPKYRFPQLGMLLILMGSAPDGIYAHHSRSMSNGNTVIKSFRPSEP